MTLPVVLPLMLVVVGVVVIVRYGHEYFLDVFFVLVGLIGEGD